MSFPSENGERKRGDVSRETKSPFSETSTNPEIRDARWRVVHAYFSGRKRREKERRNARDAGQLQVEQSVAGERPSNDATKLILQNAAFRPR